VVDIPSGLAPRRRDAEDGARFLVDEADLVRFRAAMADVGAIAIVDQRQDAAADRDARHACVATAALERRYSVVRPKNIWPKNSEKSSFDG
jgi:hypothetical protein